MRMCVALLNLFLEAAAAESIIYSAGIDIPRMLSSISDPGGENLAVPKRRAHARARMYMQGSGIPPYLSKGGNAFSGDGLCCKAELEGSLPPVRLAHSN